MWQQFNPFLLQYNVVEPLNVPSNCEYCEYPEYFYIFPLEELSVCFHPSHVSFSDLRTIFRVFFFRFCASCATGPASALLLSLSALRASLWCRTAAGAARCALGSEASRAQRCCPATGRKDCSVTSAPASLETLASVSVSGRHTWEE